MAAIKIKSKRTYAFIDSQNLNLSVGQTVRHKKSKKIVYKGWKLDFAKFFQYLEDKFNVEKAFLFIGRVPGNERLYRYLKDAGYVLIYKPTLERYEGGKHITKGNVDAELVLHSMIEYPNYDKAIIVAGDGDYHCLIKHLKQHGKLEKIGIPNRYRFSSLLRWYHKYFFFISDLRSKLEQNKKERD
jgi:uncharacterized LabA/DUF88 family protein